MNDRLERIFNKIEKVCEILGGIALLIMMSLITADSVGRYLFNHPISGVMEVTESYLITTAVFLLLSYSYAQGANVRVEILTRHFPQSVRHWLEILHGFLGVLLFMSIAITAAKTGKVAFVQGAVTGGVVATPIWPGYLVMVIGFILLVARIIQRTVTKVLVGADVEI